MSERHTRFDDEAFSTPVPYDDLPWGDTLHIIDLHLLQARKTVDEAYHTAFDGRNGELPIPRTQFGRGTQIKLVMEELHGQIEAQRRQVAVLAETINRGDFTPIVEEES